MVKNGKKCTKWSKMVKIAKNGQNGLKWSKIVQNGPKWSKMVKITKNGPKCSKMVQNGPKWSKMVQLEVGDRRAPRLLVIYIFCRCVVGGPSSGGGVGQVMMANGGLPAKASSGGGETGQ